MEFVVQNFVNHAMTPLDITNAMRVETKFVYLDGGEFNVTQQSVKQAVILIMEPVINQANACAILGLVGVETYVTNAK